MRSGSNPDLLSEAPPTSNGRLRSERGESPGSTSSSAGTPPPFGETPPLSGGMVVTFSEDTTEAAAAAMEEFLSRPAAHTPSFRPLAAVLGGIRGKKPKKKKKEKKMSLAEDGGAESPLASQSQKERDPASPLRSPAHSSPKSRTKGRKIKSSLLGHLRSHDHPDEGSEVVGERSDAADSQEELSQSLENLSDPEVKGRGKKKLLEEEPRLQHRLQISSPLTRDWSGGELRNEELQRLVRPPPPSWSMAGYLWLRLHNQQRYEWSHVVSVVGVCCES